MFELETWLAKRKIKSSNQRRLLHNYNKKDIKFNVTLNYNGPIVALFKKGKK